MFFIRHRHDHFHHADPQVEARLRAVEDKLGLIIRNQETLMIDTSRMLAEVARERTELASWKALSAAKDAALANVSASLKTATDALAAAGADTTALTAVQADIDKAASDLKNDNDDAEAALAQNVAAPA